RRPAAERRAQPGVRHLIRSIKASAAGADIPLMGSIRLPDVLIGSVMALATFVSLGPHLLMLGYRVAGAQPPAALVYFCPLHRVESGGSSKVVIHAPQLDARR